MPSAITGVELQRSLRRFITFDQVTCLAAVAVILAVYVGIHRNGYLLLLALEVAGAAGVMGLGRRPLARGAAHTAVWWLAAANWWVALGTTAVATFCVPITVAAAMLPSVLAVPYVSPGQLWAVSAGSMLVSLLVAAAGTLQDFSGLSASLDPWLRSAVTLAFVPFIAGLVVMVGAHNAAGIRRALTEALLANRRLLGSEAALRDSRTRLVEATDDERRRIARDLHDGPQQRLLAVSMTLQRAQQLLGGAASPAAKAVQDAARNLQQAVLEVRSVTHGLYPPSLTDLGLCDALAELFEATPVRGRLVCRPVLPRVMPAVEAAAYWCCREAVQNFAKHAGPAASLDLWVALERNGALVFEARDDGAGFDPGVVRRGQGLMNMTDRLAAAGGTLSVTSAPGRGTCLRGVIPHARSERRDRARAPAIA